MAHLGNSDGDELPSPEVMARIIRSGYTTYFGPPVVCVATALLFAILQEWMYSVAFAASALIYLPLSLSQYRNGKKICQGIIEKYQQWHQENGTNARH